MTIAVDLGRKATKQTKGAFALLSKCSIFHDIFKSIQNLTQIFHEIEFFQWCLKIEDDVMIYK